MLSLNELTHSPVGTEEPPSNLSQAGSDELSAVKAIQDDASQVEEFTEVVEAKIDHHSGKTDHLPTEESRIESYTV